MTTIINIRGTSGSGKSTIVREIMKLYRSRMRYRIAGRKQPLGYICDHPDAPVRAAPSLAVLGHYETACGGCDTISSLDEIYRLVREAAVGGMDVLFEGLLISAEVNRTVGLSRFPPHQLHVIALTTPIDLCLESINIRRRTKDPNKPDVNPDNTISKFRGVERSVQRLRAEGVTCHVLDRTGALALARELLRV